MTVPIPAEFTRSISRDAKEIAVNLDIALSEFPDGFTMSREGVHINPQTLPLTGYAVGGVIKSLVIRENPRSYVSA